MQMAQLRNGTRKLGTPVLFVGQKTTTLVEGLRLRRAKIIAFLNLLVQALGSEVQLGM